MKKYLFMLATLMALTSYAKVEAGLEQLRDSQFQCDIVSAVQLQNGKVERRMKDQPSVMITLNQDGGSEYTDAKCFHIPAINSEGQDSVISFGCLPLDSKHVKKFNDEKLRIKRSEYNEVLDLNFKTGTGTYSFDTRNCDWGFKCVHTQAEVEFKNCVKL